MAKVTGLPPGSKASASRRKYGTTLDELAHATLRVSQQLGVEGVTMKRVGEELGLSPMAAYRHVRGRDHLLEVAAQSILRRVTTDAPQEGSWEDQLRAVLRSLRDECAPYPWVGPYLASHATVHPPDESPTLRILRQTGLGEREVQLQLAFINAFVVGMMLSPPQPDGPEPRRARKPAAARAEPGADDYWEYGIDMIIVSLRERLGPRVNPSTRRRTG